MIRCGHVLRHVHKQSLVAFACQPPAMQAVHTNVDVARSDIDTALTPTD